MLATNIVRRPFISFIAKESFYRTQLRSVYTRFSTFRMRAGTEPLPKCCFTFWMRNDGQGLQCY